MQKRKLIPLTTLLLCSLCLSACGKPTVTNILATINGNNITAENVYDTSLYNKDVAEYYYGILEKALIESTIPVNNSMKTTVDSEVDNWVEKIKADAKLNQTDYKEDLNKALEEKGVKSVEELKAQKIYNLQKEAAKSMFLKANKDKYAELFVKENYLYHISDIQLSVSSSDSQINDYYGATTSVDQIKNIHDAIIELVKGRRFYNVAFKYSNADSKDKAGDEGIVTLKDADITNELRYALIGYSSLIEKQYDTFKDKLKFPEMTEDNKDPMYVINLYSKDAGIETIPLSYLENLEDNYETSECYSDIKDTVYTNSKVYYRNILFNALFNSKSPRFITLTADQVEKYHAQKSTILASDLGVNVLVPTEKETGFVKSEDETYVLSDEDGHPLLVYRDNNGLHITNVHMTPFDDNYLKYFSSKPDKDDDFISYSETGSNKEDRVKEVEGFADRYITKDYGDETANNKLLDFEIFKFLLTKNKGFIIVDEQIKHMIDQYMTSMENLTNLKNDIANEAYFNEFANDISVTKNIAIKEMPILSCLSKDKNGKRMCTYEYGKGFAFYTSDTTEEGGGE